MSKKQAACLSTFLALIFLQTVGSQDQILDYFLQWNEVPTEVYLGLLTESSEVVKTPLVNGTCFQYNVNGFDRCKYYSDCCAMTPSRPLEQLAPNTFSCHDGYYIVDRCPPVTENNELRDLCEGYFGALSDISIKRWPVRGKVNHLVYKNIYCAICNGVDPYDELDLQAQTFHGNLDDGGSLVSRVEWWPAKIECPKDSIEKYLEDSPNHQKLVDFIGSSCDVVFLPPEAPDLCWESERTCPVGTEIELVKLCEEGPANYISIPSTGLVYRNQFCALCNKESFYSYNQPDLANNTEAVQLTWKAKRLGAYTEEKNHMEIFAIMRPTLWNSNFNFSIFRFTSFVDNIDLKCSFFVQEEQNFCEKLLRPLAENSQNNFSDPVWNLRSASCFSAFHKVCDRLLTAKTSECSTPGCGEKSILDPHSLKCINLTTFVIGNETVLENNNLPWHSHSICAYQSQCKAVELGLLQTHELNCFCDEQCIYYNDCCEDSPYQATAETKLPDNTFHCKEDVSELMGKYNPSDIPLGIMEVNRCPGGYEDNETRRQCEEPPSRNTLSHQMIPVTDPNTGIRYANWYCAQCHKVGNIQFWRIDVGCYSVANDNCSYIFGMSSVSDMSFADAFRDDATLDILQQALESYRCSVKQYLPPKGVPTVRRCNYDAEEYISTCPPHTKDWVISDKCENSPASFVFQGGFLKQIITQGYYFPVTYKTYLYKTLGNVAIASYRQESKYRNSYCASCHGMAWLGCHAKHSFEIFSGDRDLYMQYESEVAKFLLVYKIDLNERSCRLDSDSALLYSDYTTGWDTCTTISSQLKQCNCQSILNLETGDCLRLPYYSNTNCLNSDYNIETFELSSYAVKSCGDNFTYAPLPETLALSQCLTCTDNSSSCVGVTDYAFKYNPTVEYPSIHCAPKSLTRCNSPSSSSSCLSSYSFGGLSSSLSSEPRQTKISLLNAVAISYFPAKFDFAVKMHKIAVDGFEQVFSTFTDKPLSTCSEYSLVNDSQPNWLVCHKSSLYDFHHRITYADFLLRGSELRVCTDYVEAEFTLYAYNYVFSALSIVAIIVYAVHYFGKARRSVTGNFVISSLLTLAAALVCYCLVYTGSSVGCRVIATLNQYLLISVQVWTNAIGIWMVRGISTLRRASDSGVKTYISYAAYAWLTPLVFVILAYILHWERVEAFYPVFTDNICLISSGWTRLLLFTGPIYLYILLNTVLCIAAIIMVVRSGNNITANDKKKVQKKVIAVIKLQTVFGFHWILLLFNSVPKVNISVIYIILNIFLTLQGVILVFMQFLTSKNIDKFKNTMNSLKTNLSTSSRTPDSESRSVRLASESLALRDHEK
ncbi:uncharacterized protein [Watersipora subatra]|uniref:uncharacterized protein n=1 Tax=Watersipora subatra TaxID=2589382 RepID=UPI00355C99F3